MSASDGKGNEDQRKAVVIANGSVADRPQDGRPMANGSDHRGRAVIACAVAAAFLFIRGRV
ncbi:MAG: hypothetical protein LBJ20_05415 [Candidatus Methanoplasma sp.]|nr:hypothetical protein [Candidatus Methanoplasma sp.]